MGHMEVHELRHAIAGVRRYTRFPYFGFKNLTEQTLSLTTYAPGARFYSSMTTDVTPGTCYISCSRVTVTVEEGIFTAPDGRQSRRMRLQAFQDHTVRPEDFD